MDPDQVLRERGTEFLIRELQKAESFLDFKLSCLRRRLDLSSASGKAEALEEFGRTVGLIDDDIKRGLYVREVAEKIGVDERLASLAVSKVSGRSRRGPKIEVRVEELVGRGAELVERKILALLLQNPELVQRVRGRLFSEDFSQESHRLIMDRLLSADDGHLREPAKLMNSFSNRGLGSIVAKLCFLQEEGQAGQMMEAYVRKLESNRLTREKQALQEQLRNAEKSNDLPLVKQLSQRLKEIAEKRTQAARSSP
jgi:DNA primase